MGEIGLMDTSATTDLLTLIGSAIEQLRRCIALFETAEAAAGAEHLSAVIDEIDGYLAASDQDPLLRLASLSPSHIREGLLNVRTDLTSVIDEVHRPRN
jgi:hypothetical protein